MFWRVLKCAVGCGMVVGAALPACGGDSSNSSDGPSGGSSGSGVTRGGSAGKPSNGSAGKPSTPGVVSCGTSKCRGVTLSKFMVPGCCADAATNRCGLDSSTLSMFGQMFDGGCQPLAEPGTKDAACADSPPVSVPGSGFTVSFQGCCQATGKCGYNADSIAGVITLGLGCIDSAPFLDGGTAMACGDGSGGEGGSPPASSVSGAGTAGAAASSSAGASGASTGGASTGGGTAQGRSSGVAQGGAGGH